MKNKEFEFYIQITLIIVLVGLLMFSLGKSSGSSGEIIKIVSASEIIPTGTPEVYGEELGISYDDISASNPKLADSTIKLLGNIDRSKILEGTDLDRYTKILYELNKGISCEYCCGARSIIFENGEPACGCAHSYAMRGLTKYLLINHPDMSNEEILAEIGKWKVLFFPGIMEQKAQILEANGIDSKDYINLASNLYRGIEKGQTSGRMVGSC